MRYAIVFWTVATVCVVEATTTGGWAFTLFWPATGFGAAGLAYAGVGPRLFGKRSDGTLSPLAVGLLLPYLLYAWGLWHLWRLATREPPFHELGDGITLGRRLLPRELPGHVRIVYDLTCEFPEPLGIRSAVSYRCLPTLDARPPSVTALRQAAQEILNADGGVYIHCANGHGRTGTLAGAVLLLGGRAKTPDEAIEMMCRSRPRLSLNSTQKRGLQEVARRVREELEEGAPASR